MDSAISALSSTEFLTGLGWGAGALAVGLIVSLLWQRFRQSPAPIIGLLVATSALGAMPEARETPEALWQGLAMLAAAGLLFPWVRNVPLLPAILATPGAWWVIRRTDLPGARWVLCLLFITIVVGGPLTASFDHSYGDRGFGTVLIAVTIVGAFSTLPDTEEILVLLGAMLPLVLLAWPKVLASLGGVGAYPIIGILVWVIAWGGRGRETAVIGAAASLGILVVEPIARWMRGRAPLASIPHGMFGVMLAGVIHIALVLVTARLAGLRRGLAEASAIAIVVLVAAVTLLLAASSNPLSRRRRS